jgi:SAM-dependent methyltransferase
LKSKIHSLLHNPSILKDIIQGKSVNEIRINIKKENESQAAKLAEKEILDFISNLKQTSPYFVDPNDNPQINRLCYIEDWQNKEISDIISQLQNASLPSYINKQDWEMTTNIVNRRKTGLIHRKDWEWALGIIAMRRFGKLNEKSTAIGVGAGREEVLFYLANNLKHVYATDLYDGNNWKNFAPSDFPENPKKYAPFPYKEDALTVLRMDGTKLEFPSESFDIAFSFSSIEHFDGDGDRKNHSGALRSLKEIERVLKPGGLAVITTEYIINDKEHPEFFNRRTIYSDLIDKLERLKLVEPLDLRISTKTLDTVMDYPSAVYWDASSNDDDFKKNHPLVLIRVGNVLVTSLLLTLQKKND